MFAIDEEGRIYKTNKKVLETHLGSVELSKKENISNTGKRFYKIMPSLRDDIKFIKRGGEAVLIASLNSLEEAMKGRAGTLIHG